MEYDEFLFTVKTKKLTQTLTLKAALINIFTLAVDQMTMDNVKGATGGERTTNSHHSSPQQTESF